MKTYTSAMQKLMLINGMHFHEVCSILQMKNEPHYTTFKTQ